MSNEITNGPAPLPNPYAEYSNEISNRSGIIGQLLRFTKHGEYKAGQDQETVPEGTRMLAHLPSMRRGWVCWKDQQPVQQIMGLVAEGFKPPLREELGDLDEAEWEEQNGKPKDPWQKTNHLIMADSDGELFTFTTSSKGGLSAVAELLDAYAKRYRMKPDEIPVIELLARSYIHKDYGETFAPKLKVVGWTLTPESFKDASLAMLEDYSDETLELSALMPGNGNGDDGEEPEPEPGPGPEPEPATTPRPVLPKPTPQPAQPHRAAFQSPKAAAGKVSPKAPVKPPSKPVGRPAGKAGKPAGKPAAGKRSIRF
jgi:hypothetical protein